MTNRNRRTIPQEHQREIITAFTTSRDITPLRVFPCLPGQESVSALMPWSNDPGRRSILPLEEVVTTRDGTGYRATRVNGNVYASKITPSIACPKKQEHPNGEKPVSRTPPAYSGKEAGRQHPQEAAQ